MMPQNNDILPVSPKKCVYDIFDELDPKNTSKALYAYILRSIHQKLDKV